MNYADSCFFVGEWFQLCIVESQLLPRTVDIASDNRVFFAGELTNEFIAIFIED